jgi:hypothetical protein
LDDSQPDAYYETTFQGNNVFTGDKVFHSALGGSYYGFGAEVATERNGSTGELKVKSRASILTLGAEKTVSSTGTETVRKGAFTGVGYARGAGYELEIFIGYETAH